ncbi:MAG: NUDIX hydrolase [Flavobacteriales bacterium]|nr:NUDIX hydrolase [Flavobacteriales bacterium]
MDNPWKILKKELAYKNDWIEVYHHEVLNPSGNSGIYGTVEFKNLAVGVIPIDTSGNTYLVGQYRFPLNAYSWEIPEGGCKAGTNPLITAKRELKEETGIIAKKWQEIQQIHTSNSVTNEVGYIYLAEELSFEEAQPDDDEQLIIKKVSLKQAYEMVESGEITDSLSLAGIMKLKITRPELF